MSAEAYRFMLEQSGTVATDVASGAAFLQQINDTFAAIFGKIGQYADAFADTLVDFGETAYGEMIKSSNQLLVGLGGSVVGDAVEFLNVSYDAIKIGIRTGDWSDFGDAIVQFGAAAVLSAVLVTGSVVATAAIVGAVSAAAAPIAASFVAAGWAAYGLYDAVTNGAELLEKITSDLAENIPKIGNTIEETGEVISTIMRVVTTAFAADFEIPEFNAVNDNLYLVDTADISLPDATQDGAVRERAYYGE